LPSSSTPSSVSPSSLLRLSRGCCTTTVGERVREVEWACGWGCLVRGQVGLYGVSG
jgi:hypothetical protein